MNLADLTEKLAEIRAQAYDDEGAHALQDQLFVDVLDAIATGTAEPSAQALAAEALQVNGIEFSRWYA